uniref:Uncharacterized protein n=1 Tax=Panagrolaimus sp. JU765 TaxID=591449 RepID=A0AC34PV47_9BILA
MDESSLSTTPESSLKRPSISTHSNLSSDRSPVKSCQRQSPIPLFGELWSWGNNQNGQLGHADTISRREPKKIRTISGPIVKISVGDDHNVVLMASGEAFVWGSNSKEQLKYLNQSFLDTPTLWRLGAESTILDVEAGKELTAAIVVGQSRKEQVLSSIFLFGKQKETNSSTTILSKIEQIGSPAKLFLLSDNIWFGTLNNDDVLENKTYSKIQAVSKVARFSGQLTVLAQKLINSSQDVEIIQLLKNLCEKVGIWNEIQSKLAAEFFKALTFYGDVKLSIEVAKNCGFRDICRSILELHFAFIEAIAFRCFSEIKLESDLAVQVEKLCLDYNTESNLQQRRLRYLFGRPFDFFKALRPVLDNTMVGFHFLTIIS